MAVFSREGFIFMGDLWMNNDIHSKLEVPLAIVLRKYPEGLVISNMNRIIPKIPGFQIANRDGERLVPY